ncbi:MAG: trypsin-like peptidase domain-containing protein [Nocardioides sp.]
MSDEHPSSDETPSAADGDVGWLPPREQPLPHQWAPPGPVAAGGPSDPPGLPPAPQYAVQSGPHTSQQTASKGGVPGRLWPVVSVLALVVGVIGGVVGGAAYESWHRTGSDGRVSGGLLAAGISSRAPLPAGNHSVASVAQDVLPSTVQVLAQYHGKKDGATGSGFVLDRSGHYITNNHVVADAVSNDGPIEIMDQDGDRYPAKVVGRSATYDLAVLYVKGGPRLPPASLGSAEALHVGDPVVAFGSPLGLSSTVTAGIVSALNRPVTTSESGSASSYINAVQTDAAINPGNSGGPLVDLAGQVVGVNSAIATTGSSGAGQAGNIGVGFAIPIEQVKITADQILRTGRARYPVIGATVNTGDTTDTGARILAVNADGPADRGGLRKGDVVTAVAGEKVANGIALIVAIRAHQPGDTVPFTVRRGSSEMRLRITLGSQVG